MSDAAPVSGTAALSQLVNAEKEIRQLGCPPHHVLMLPILRRLARLKLEVYRLRSDASSAKAFTEAALQFVRLYERVTPYPCQQLMDELYNASAALAFPPFETDWALAKEYATKALRMHLILCGREVRDAEYDAHLPKILTKMKDIIKTATPKGSGDNSSNKQEDVGGCTSDKHVDTLGSSICAPAQCGFCEESPTRAAAKLSVCGRCKQVAYCSQGCQKAHWKLHKTCCGK
jgi:hypothetical protein